jgi:hypothetical protein
MIIDNQRFMKTRIDKRNAKQMVVLTVNQRVSGSSPEGGAKLDKPSAMMAFSLSINALG